MALNNAFQEIINKRVTSRFAGVCAYQTMYDSLSKVLQCIGGKPYRLAARF